MNRVFWDVNYNTRRSVRALQYARAVCPRSMPAHMSTTSARASLSDLSFHKHINYNAPESNIGLITFP